jgi:four helix bundle protein
LRPPLGHERLDTQFLSTARGSSAELSVLLEIAHSTGSIDDDVFRRCENTVDRISAMINGLVKRNKSS